MPAVAGLPAEAITNSYNDLGMLTGTDGMTDYVQNIGYSPYGEIEETRLGISTGAKQLQIPNRYEDGTRRLAITHTVDQTNTGYTNEVDYAYDTTAKKFSAQHYYPTGDATAVRTESGLNWMVDDHHGTASMTVDATTQGRHPPLHQALRRNPRRHRPPGPTTRASSASPPTRARFGGQFAEV
jgi:hypothetical protein